MEFANGIFLFEIFHFESHLWNVENVFELYNYWLFYFFFFTKHTINRRRDVAISVQRSHSQWDSNGAKEREAKLRSSFVRRAIENKNRRNEKKTNTSAV